MFQNIQNQEEQYNNKDVELNKENIKDVLVRLFTKQNILLYIISFMISTISFGENINPFAIAILAAVCSNDVPMGIIYILTLIGTGIGFGKEGLIIYFLTSLIFIVTLSMFKVKVNVKNGNKKLGVRICVASTIAQIVKLAFGKILIYDILTIVTSVVAIAIFYKIFETAVRVIKDSEEKKAFAVEEILATSVLIAIAIAGFKDILIFGYSVRNILSIFIVLVLGWQNGILIGGSTGIIIGLIMGIVTGDNILQISTYAISRNDSRITK